MKVTNEIDDDLAKLIERDFGDRPARADLDNKALDWLHYLARRIPARPRAVTLSNNAIAKLSTYPAIADLKSELELGQDVSPRLSNRIRTQKSKHTADPMFNDWQISHFHLGRAYARPDSTSRTRELLFAYLTGEKAVLLDVGDHSSWSKQDLLSILLSTDEAEMTPYEMNGVLGLSQNYSDDDLAKLRSGGVSSSLQIQGRFFMSPGMGVTTSKHGVRFTMFLLNLRRAMEALEKDIAANNFTVPGLSPLREDILCPVKLGLKYAAGQFEIYDKNRGLTLRLSQILS